ncbi:hypothetical protein BDQ12DRAFT_301067 [Crucibulum laeve]|uniref:rRNA-processing protein FYV7 n=1 Tax=Crucibulum laeve TaxID=68775 RepID=A0A5C3MEW6_9AGAR|nr:hypothetical protein BDQ12DRAFT_301067 [Crucibulum laeve]
MTEVTKKRKQPPTFQHYPINRAKKLKQTWVQTAKIKSKWKAEKRKDDITSSSKLDLPEYNEEEEKKEEGSDDGSSSAEEIVVKAPAPPPKEHLLHPSRAHIHPTLAPPKQKQKPTKVDKQKEEEKADPEKSIRDLTREAYSRSTLHTYKADPLKWRGQSSRGRGGFIGETGRGRGQPNMKLRMNAMLEKIKQDFA